MVNFLASGDVLKVVFLPDPTHDDEHDRCPDNDKKPEEAEYDPCRVLHNQATGSTVTAVPYAYNSAAPAATDEVVNLTLTTALAPSCCAWAIIRSMA